MIRRSLGRGRLILSIGGLIVLAGTLPPWWTVGGDVLPATSGNAFEGPGILVFIAAIGLLALVTLPYATANGTVGLDRPASFVLVTAVAVAGFLLMVLDIARDRGLGLPDRAPGLWVSGIGLAMVVWGVAELLGERPARY